MVCWREVNFSQVLRVHGRVPEPPVLLLVPVPSSGGRRVPGARPWACLDMTMGRNWIPVANKEREW